MLIAVALSATPAAHPTPPQLVRCKAKGILKEFTFYSNSVHEAELKVNVSGTCTGGPDGKYTVTAFGWGSFRGSCSEDLPCDDWHLRPAVSLRSRISGKTKTREQEWTSEYLLNGTRFVVDEGGGGVGGIDYGSSCGETEGTYYCHSVEINWSFTYRRI